MPKSILVVDDSTAFRYALRKMLDTVKDLKVCGEAVDGLEAVEMASLLSPDLIVMDFAMPRANGIEAARRIKRNARDTPIILYTLHKDALSRLKTDLKDISSVVEKGFTTDLLVAEIQRLLRAHPTGNGNASPTLQD
jgi:CheY-like chemotaxis protein